MAGEGKAVNALYGVSLASLAVGVIMAMASIDGQIISIFIAAFLIFGIAGTGISIGGKNVG